MEITVGFPEDKWFRFQPDEQEENCVLAKLNAKKIKQIGSQVSVSLKDGVCLSIPYVEDYDENSTFISYQSRAESYAKWIMEKLMSGAE